MGAKLSGQTIKMPMKTGEGGRLYGAVTAMDVAAALEKAGYKVDKRMITINTHVKSVGTFEAELKLHHEVTIKLSLDVVSIG